MERLSLRARRLAEQLPWVKWQVGNEYLASLPGHRERVTLEAWFDRRKQSLVLTVTRYDESQDLSEPCWAQVALAEVGPFFAHDELMSFSSLWVDTTAAMFGLPVGFDRPTEAPTAQRRLDELLALLETVEE